MSDHSDTYPLSPLQQGMLFHTLSAPDSGVDIEQVICTLHQPLDRTVFQKAWETVTNRHAALRSRFDWSHKEAPFKTIQRDAAIDWRLEDWQQQPAEQQAEMLERYLDQDRRQDFAMDQAPLMRLALFQCSSDCHQCVWTFHHAILDGRSFPIVLSEVFECYRALLADETPKLTTAPPFAEFVQWLNERPKEQEERFWKEQLGGFSSPTPIPSKTLATSGETSGETSPGPQLSCEHHLPEELTRQIESTAEALSVTVNTLLQGAWALLLSNYSGYQEGQRDVVFGTTRACRHGTVSGAESMVGLFINTVPLRITWDSQTTTREFLQLVRAKHLLIRPFEHTALVDVQRWSSVPPSLPLFETLLVFERQTLNEQLRARGGEWHQRSFEYRGQTNFPLALIAYGGTELLLRFEYDASRFDSPMVSCMLGHLGQLISQMVANLDSPVNGLSYVTAEEKEFLLGQPATTRVALDGSRRDAGENQVDEKFMEAFSSIHGRFESCVAKEEDRVAVSYQGESITYGELNRRANRVAHHLRSLGVGPDVLVGLSTARDIDVIVGVLGILKAGGAYVPLDLAYPAQRRSYMLDDSRAPVILTQRPLVDQLPETNATIVCIDEISQDESVSATNPEPCNTSADLAYVIYTSGSTGNPKGALVTHENVLRLFTATDPWFQFGKDDVWTLFHSYAFDFSVWEIWGALLYGGRLVVVPYLVSRSPDEFHKLLCNEHVTVLNQTPSAFRQLIQADQSQRGSTELSLRYVIFGGESLEMQSLQPWFDRHGDLQPKLINMYGITETTVHVTYRPITADDLAGGSVIGTPIPDLQVYILDPYGNPVPIGVPGEMFVAGKGLARGYLRRDQLTSERFLPNPFNSQPDQRIDRTGERLDRTGERVYRTGDLARFLPNRDIEYLGRIDHQVKIRGFRIELGEIESVLCEHAEVREAIVTVREDEPGEKRLVAYLVCDSAPPSNSQLREHLQVKLPVYMVPATFVSIDKFPLTPNGKVDHKSLPVPDAERPELHDHYLAPRTPEEKTLHDIWADVLRIERVGINDNFFDLGGNSLLMVRIHQDMQRLLGRDFHLVALFQYPTISSLAKHVSGSRQVSEPATDVRNRAERQRNAMGNIRKRIKRQVKP